MKHAVRGSQPAQVDDFLSRVLCSAYVDLVREELMHLPAADDLLIPLSGSEAITVTEYDARFRSRQSR